MKHSSRTSVFGTLVFLIVVLVSLTVQAQSDGEVPDGTMIVDYYGRQTTLQELGSIAGHDTYCALDVTEEVVKRGYFDARYDTLLCYNTQLEVWAQSERNTFTIESVESNIDAQASETSKDSRAMHNATDQFSALLAQSGCTGNRATGFLYTFYNTNWSDVCAGQTVSRTYNGQYVRSSWMIGSCSAMTVVQNTWPTRQTVFIDYSAAVLYIYAVAEIRWQPKSSPC